MKKMPVAAAVLLLSLAACAPRRGNGDGPHVEPPEAVAGEPDVFQTGVASWYGDDFHGKVTADGEIYDMHKLTAAHQNLPFHTLVEVENLENGKKVLVRINDRGPFLKGRIIDLSLKAARLLEIAEKGTAPVSLRVLRWGELGGAVAGAPAREGTSPPSGPAASCYVQAGAFTLKENAEDMILTLEEIFPGQTFRIIVEDGLFKVLSAGQPSMNACRDMIRELAARHLEGFIREAVYGGDQ